MAGYKTLKRRGQFSAVESSLLDSCYLPAGWGDQMVSSLSQGSKDFEVFLLSSSLWHLGISEIVIMIIWAYLI